MADETERNQGDGSSRKALHEKLVQSGKNEAEAAIILASLDEEQCRLINVKLEGEGAARGCMSHMILIAIIATVTGFATNEFGFTPFAVAGGALAIGIMMTILMAKTSATLDQILEEYTREEN